MTIKEFSRLFYDPMYSKAAIFYADSDLQSDVPFWTGYISHLPESSYAEYSIEHISTTGPEDISIAIHRQGRYTPYEQLIRDQLFYGSIEIIEKATGKQGVANTVPFADNVQVFYGEDDGSDDKTITADEFNIHFDIINVI